MKDSILYTTGYPRSGTWWITRLLSDLLDSPIWTLPPDNMRVRHFYQIGKGGYTIYKTHWRVKDWVDNGKIGNVVFIQRDPRDVAVSAMYFSSLENTSDNLLGVIKIMVWLNPNVDFQTYHENGVYDQWIRDWLDERDVIKVKYECLHHEPVKELIRICDLLGEAVSAENVLETLERQRFEYWQKKFSHAMRKGIVGDWVNHFQRQHGELITGCLGALMMEQGYIESLDWWKTL